MSLGCFALKKSLTLLVACNLVSRLLNDMLMSVTVTALVLEARLCLGWGQQIRGQTFQD
jgi:hypothetical protein